MINTTRVSRIDMSRGGARKKMRSGEGLVVILCVPAAASAVGDAVSGAVHIVEGRKAKRI